MHESEMARRARRFLAGERLAFDAVFAMLGPLKQQDQLSLARRILERIRKREDDSISDGVPDRDVNGIPTRDYLCQQEALLTSKDPELSASLRHDQALRILARGFRFINDRSKAGDAETLGIAGGICKRKWNDLGQVKDLMRAADFYTRGAANDLRADPYPHINAAFVDDLLAAAGVQPTERRQQARALRQRIVDELPEKGGWWHVATRAEALFGLGRYEEATRALAQVDKSEKRAPWELRTMAEQLAQLAHLHARWRADESGGSGADPLDDPAIRQFFEALLPGAQDAVRSVTIGKVGLALSGGGFRASFYHLGVLACLAERNALRDVEVLSCVSGGSIVGACYWLKLRQRLQQSPPPSRGDYIELVRELIQHFLDAVKTDPRRSIQPSKGRAIWNFARGAKGVLDPERMAAALEEDFYRPLWGPRPSAAPIQMHELAFQPADHDPVLTGSDAFNPGRHNWLRGNKVPALILNATTVNTGHAWHFTPTWMGESPWAVHAAADSIQRLEWHSYSPANGWQMALSRAVAASACVPLVFEPLRLDASYGGIEVTLVDGGVHDNQGTVALLAADCNVVLVSDACGQLTLQAQPPQGMTAGLSAGSRSMDTLMERVRLANYADLAARQRTGLLRHLMFLHMKAGLDADVIRLPFSSESYTLEREKLTPFGVLRDLQQALAELRTDLDAFTEIESAALMACGYKMASQALESDLPELGRRWQPAPYDNWAFKVMLEKITTVDIEIGQLNDLLKEIRAGKTVALD